MADRVERLERYYHGGTRGLRVGDFLLPPDETGNETSLSRYVKAIDPEKGRTDRVFVTTSIKAARLYAAQLPHGAVYKVEPVGEIEEDPDYTPDEGEAQISFMCEKARIIKVVDPRVAMKHGQAVYALRRFVS